MPEFFDVVDRCLRRNPCLPRLAWLRNRLRRPYHRLMSVGSSGLPLTIGGAVAVRVPAKFCARELQQYETETVQALAKWIRAHPGSVIIDIGSSYGYMSCAALFCDRSTTVYAIDADLESLAITRQVCSQAPEMNERLILLRTLIGPVVDQPIPINSIVERSMARLNRPDVTGDPCRTNYVNLDSRISADELPRSSLDQLFLPELARSGRPYLIKCDVEGAEQCVLQGAIELMKTVRPTWLLSVHPNFLGRYNSSEQEIRRLFDEAGYQTTVIAVDHEQHWLAEPEC